MSHFTIVEEPYILMASFRYNYEGNINNNVVNTINPIPDVCFFLKKKCTVYRLN